MWEMVSSCIATMSHIEPILSPFDESGIVNREEYVATEGSRRYEIRVSISSGNVKGVYRFRVHGNMVLLAKWCVDGSGVRVSGTYNRHGLSEQRPTTGTRANSTKYGQCQSTN